MIIAIQFGIALLGVYTVAAKFYQTMLLLLHSGLNEVSLPFLSKIADDKERIAAIYR